MNILDHIIQTHTIESARCEKYVCNTQRNFDNKPTNKATTLSYQSICHTQATALEETPVAAKAYAENSSLCITNSYTPQNNKKQQQTNKQIPPPPEQNTPTPNQTNGQTEIHR